MLRPLLLWWYIQILLFIITVVPEESKKFYLSTERPMLTYYNPKYLTFVNISALRYNRRNPVYYVDLHFNVLVLLDNNVIVKFAFYEYYNSQFRRSFLDLRYKWCNLVYKDQFFGPALRKNLPKTCPHQPGEYHLYNMTAIVEGIPNFPIVQGRIYCNITLKNDEIANGYIDMELKRMRTQSPGRGAKI